MGGSSWPTVFCSDVWLNCNARPDLEEHRIEKKANRHFIRPSTYNTCHVHVFALYWISNRCIDVSETISLSLKNCCISETTKWWSTTWLVPDAKEGGRIRIRTEKTEATDLC